MKQSYSVKPYNPAFFNQIRHLESAQQILQERAVEESAIKSLRSLFHRHDVHKALGLMILHRHFDMTPDEKLVEFRGVATPWPVNDESEVFGGKIVAKCWAFYQGGLHPTEFGFNPPGEPSYLETTFQAEFVQELYEFLSLLKLDDIFGLVSLSDSDLLSMRGVERTIGRVSITLPLSEDIELPDTIESVWAFGCHESMDNSSLWPARICWVCQGCKEKKITAIAS